MKTPEQEYFTQFLAETPNGVYKKLSATKNPIKSPSSIKKKGFFSCCSKTDDESELNMTR
jgi:hypothetical protein